ncbi:hypothetical protein [Serratia nevei]|uniref:hypothetical protein n=1 Tax=Serratia nevei TaxID=2703794 RepID=UPI00254B9B80|nr:hypothetical protein [Serratia nevei]MEC5619588.1 hypothetical protein [Serratia nevei]
MKFAMRGAAFVFNAATPEEEEIRPLFDRSQQYMVLLERLQVCKNDLDEETAVSQLKVVRKTSARAGSDCGD